MRGSGIASRTLLQVNVQLEPWADSSAKTRIASQPDEWIRPYQVNARARVCTRVVGVWMRECVHGCE